MDLATNALLSNNKIPNIQFYSKRNPNQVQDIYSTEGFTFENLYDMNLNRNLQDPPLIRSLGDGRLTITLRVEFRKLFRTAICKVPINEYLDNNLWLQQMQIWSTLPYHRRLVRPLCFAQLNEETPLVFIED